MGPKLDQKVIYHKLISTTGPEYENNYK